MLPPVLAVIHLLSLVFGVTVLVLRAQALARAERGDQLKPVFLWDNLYALVAFFWLGSGLLRAFGGFEKGTDYYLSNHAFWTKVLFLVVLLGAEGFLMVRFIRWRIALKRGAPVVFDGKRSLLRLHWVELWSIAGMVAMAVLMARGVGVVQPKPEGTIQTRAGLPDGAAIYRMRCLTCHQVDGRGLDGKLAADFAAEPARLAKPESALIASVTQGVPNTAMRAFGGELREDEIASVVQYVRARFGKAGATARTP